jgi:hypothetical protein
MIWNGWSNTWPKALHAKPGRKSMWVGGGGRMSVTAYARWIYWSSGIHFGFLAQSEGSRMRFFAMSRKLYDSQILKDAQSKDLIKQVHLKYAPIAPWSKPY